MRSDRRARIDAVSAELGEPIVEWVDAQRRADWRIGYESLAIKLAGMIGTKTYSPSGATLRRWHKEGR